MDNKKTVTVLAPNGRRQIVKVNPNTTILQIIEEVCKKQGLKPEDYDIKHHNKCIDTSTIIRFSGLPNNAQLELTEAKRTRLDGIVTIGIQLENGTRLLDSFSPSASIWEVLMKLCPEETNLDTNPVVIYMRKEMYGINLFQETTLRSLGLISGRAMLRIIHRSPEELQKQANVSTPIPSKPIEEKPYIRTFKKIDVPLQSPVIPEPLPLSMDIDIETKQDTAVKPNNNSNNMQQKKLTQFVKEEKQKQGKNPIIKNTTKQNYEKENTASEEDFVFLGARNAMVFSQETAVAVPASELPDDFFDLTISDAKKLLKDIKKRRLELENAPLQTSVLRDLERSKVQLCQLNKYKQTIIRISFPDQTVLQGTFNPIETVGEVLEFVKEYLENHWTDCYLYTAPPKQILNVSSRLIEIGCVPNAVLHFGSNTLSKCEVYLKRTLVNKFTTASIASLAAAKMRQQTTRAQTTMDYDDDILISDDVNVGASTSSGTPTYEDYPSRRSPPKDKQVPKWFKPSK